VSVVVVSAVVRGCVVGWGVVVVGDGEVVVVVGDGEVVVVVGDGVVDVVVGCGVLVVVTIVHVDSLTAPKVDVPNAHGSHCMLFWASMKKS
jgi:hypothetical protein